MRKIAFFMLAFAAAGVSLDAQTTRWIVSLRTPAAVHRLQLTTNAAAAAAHDVRTFRTAPFLAADLTPAEAAALRQSPDVAWVQPVVERHASEVSSSLVRRTTAGAHDRAQSVPYGIDTVRARAVWPYARGGGVNIALVDTGIDYHHPDLAGRYAGGYNAFTKTDDAMDDYGHGTHVAGTIAADDNGFGVVGVAPEVRIWAAKALDSRGGGSDESLMAAMDWAIQKKREIGGNWIMNLSLGAAAASDGERALMATAVAENFLVIAAAGNRNLDYIEYPAAYPGVLAISALGSDGNLASFSNHGAGIAFAAPGVDVLSTVPVGSQVVASINRTPEGFSALPLAGSPFGEVSGVTVYCGLGKPEEFPTMVQGNVAVIRRGELTFRDKVRNAIDAGAIGVIIVPTADDPLRGNWTLQPTPDDVNYPWIVALSTSQQDGQALVSRAGNEIVTLSYAVDDYGVHSGTSMATPHVTGVAALVWSLAPTATAAQIAMAMKLTAEDRGARGYDPRFGYGVIDALAAARYVAPGLFNLPPPPPPPDGRRRSVPAGH